MPFGIQPVHLIVIAIVALLIFGPSRLPEIGRSIGKAMVEFRKGAKEMTEGLREEISKPLDETQQTIHPSPMMTTAQPVAGGGPQTQGMAPMPLESLPVDGNGRFCTNCGTANPGDANFCKKCGSQLNS
jgi:sec-independent protein translocase protein TatA